MERRQQTAQLDWIGTISRAGVIFAPFFLHREPTAASSIERRKHCLAQITIEFLQQRWNRDCSINDLLARLNSHLVVWEHV